MLFHLFAPPYHIIFVNYSSPFGINDHKRWAQILDRLGETMTSEDHFSNLIQSRSLAEDI
jgi:hypothetical protein